MNDVHFYLATGQQQVVSAKVLRLIHFREDCHAIIGCWLNPDADRKGAITCKVADTSKLDASLILQFNGVLVFARLVSNSASILNRLTTWKPIRRSF